MCPSGDVDELTPSPQIDKVKAKGAMKEIGIAKVCRLALRLSAFSVCSDTATSQFVVVNACLNVVDRSMQAHGAEGLCQDTPLAQFWANLRTLRFADVRRHCSLLGSDALADAFQLDQGPDEVHIQQIGKTEAKRAAQIKTRFAAIEQRAKQISANGGLKAKL